MKELRYGEKIKVGDKVDFGNKMRPVVYVDTEYCLVKLNIRTFIRFPIIYSEEFKRHDELDELSYTVYRE